MKNTIVITSIVFAACAAQQDSSGEAGAQASAGADRPVLMIGRHSQSPRGDLTVSADGLWLYTSEDACKFVQGHFEADKLGQIKRWVQDDSLDSLRMSHGDCTDEQYMAGSVDDKGAVFMCLDADVKSDAGQALIQLFQDSASAVMWDGVKRECMGSGPGTINVSDKAKEKGKTEPPPPAHD